MLLSFDDLVAELRGIDGLQPKGKRGENFYLRSKAFLHFHAGGYADVRFSGDWERVPVRTPEERQALVDRVRAHLTPT